MAIGFMWNYQVVELTGVPEPDEATLNPYGLIGYELVAVTTGPQRADWWRISSAAHSRRMQKTSRRERRELMAIPFAVKVVLK